MYIVVGFAQLSWLSLGAHSGKAVRGPVLGHLATGHVVIMDKMLCSLGSAARSSFGPQDLRYTQGRMTRSQRSWLIGDCTKGTSLYIGVLVLVYFQKEMLCSYEAGLLAAFPGDQSEYIYI